MKVKEIVCHLCGKNAVEISAQGLFLRKISFDGVNPVVLECSPGCDFVHEGQDYAVTKNKEGKID